MKSRLPVLMMPFSIARERDGVVKDLQGHSQPSGEEFTAPRGMAVPNKTVEAAYSPAPQYPGVSVTRRRKKRFG